MSKAMKAKINELLEQHPAVMFSGGERSGE